MIIIKICKKWHILKDDKENQEQPSGVRTIRLWSPQWLYAPIVELGTFITPYVENVAIIEGNWQSKKKQPYNPSDRFL
jgi:hypothetical protein